MINFSAPSWKIISFMMPVSQTKRCFLVSSLVCMCHPVFECTTPSIHSFCLNYIWKSDWVAHVNTEGCMNTEWWEPFSSWHWHIHRIICNGMYFFITQKDKKRNIGSQVYSGDQDVGDTKLVPLSLDHLQSAFYVLFSSLILSTIIFIIEIFHRSM